PRNINGIIFANGNFRLESITGRARNINQVSEGPTGIGRARENDALTHQVVTPDDIEVLPRIERDTRRKGSTIVRCDVAWFLELYAFFRGNQKRLRNPRFIVVINNIDFRLADLCDSDGRTESFAI